jgi:hypothetical protein
VEKRPQRAIGEAVVVFLYVLVLEIDRRGRHALVAMEGELAGVGVGTLARPAEPDAAMFAQRRLQRHGKAALRARVWSAGRMHTVGYDYQPAHRMALHGLLSRPAQLIRPTSE